MGLRQIWAHRFGMLRELRRLGGMLAKGFYQSLSIPMNMMTIDLIINIHKMFPFVVATAHAHGSTTHGGRRKDILVVRGMRWKQIGKCVLFRK